MAFRFLKTPFERQNNVEYVLSVLREFLDLPDHEKLQKQKEATENLLEIINNFIILFDEWFGSVLEQKREGFNEAVLSHLVSARGKFQTIKDHLTAVVQRDAEDHRLPLNVPLCVEQLKKAYDSCQDMDREFHHLFMDPKAHQMWVLLERSSKLEPKFIEFVPREYSVALLNAVNFLMNNAQSLGKDAAEYTKRLAELKSLITEYEQIRHNENRISLMGEDPEAAQLRARIQTYTELLVRLEHRHISTLYRHMITLRYRMNNFKVVFSR